MGLEVGAIEVKISKLAVKDTDSHRRIEVGYMLDEIIINLIQNRKRYLYAFVGFIVSLLLVTVGIFETIFILLVTFVGYCLGSPVLLKGKKIKNILSEKLNEE